MKQFIVLLVFTLGKEYRVRHRVLCVVVLGFGSSLCSLCCGCLICVKKCSPNCTRLCFREVSCAFANASILAVFGYMMDTELVTSRQYIPFHRRSCPRAIARCRPARHTGSGHSDEPRSQSSLSLAR